jgi:hypothetical protein
VTQSERDRMAHKALMAVSAQMETDPRGKALLDRFVADNPHYDGADVADVIDVLADTDSCISWTEPLYDTGLAVEVIRSVISQVGVDPYIADRCVSYAVTALAAALQESPSVGHVRGVAVAAARRIAPAPS